MRDAARVAGRAGAVSVVAALLVLLVVHVATAHRGTAVAGAVAAGRHPNAPDFELPRLGQAGRIRLSSLRGRVVVLNFWASWCVACKGEARVLERASRRWRSRGVVFVGIDTQDFKRDARAFSRRYGLTYASVHDASGGVMTSYGVTGFPETWTIARDGRIAARVAGPVNAKSLDRAVERAERT